MTKLLDKLSVRNVLRRELLTSVCALTAEKSLADIEQCHGQPKRMGLMREMSHELLRRCSQQ